MTFVPFVLYVTRDVRRKHDGLRDVDLLRVDVTYTYYEGILVIFTWKKGIIYLLKSWLKTNGLNINTVLMFRYIDIKICEKLQSAHHNIRYVYCIYIHS